MDGVGICAENYTRWIHKEHGEAYIFVPSAGKYIDCEPFPVIRTPSVPFVLLNPYRLGLPWLSRKVTRLLKSIPFSIVHSHTPAVAGRTARRTAIGRGIPHVTTFHTKYRDDIARIVGDTRIVDRIVAHIVRFYESADAVIVPNKATVETLRSYGYQGDPQVIPNGSDLEAVSPHVREQYARRGQEFTGVRPGEFVFLFVGQHRWEKNVRLIIEALGRLRQLIEAESHTESRQFVALFVGEGKDGTQMRRLAESVGLMREAVFLGKIVDREALKCIYSRADLFLFPSLYDTSGLVMQEAAAFSVPSVVADGASAAEVIRDGENGFVTEDDPEAMARLLRVVIDQPELIKRVGRTAQRTVHRTWQSSVNTAVELYRELIKEKNTHNRLC